MGAGTRNGEYELDVRRPGMGQNAYLRQRRGRHGPPFNQSQVPVTVPGNGEFASQATQMGNIANQRWGVAPTPRQ